MAFCRNELGCFTPAIITAQELDLSPMSLWSCCCWVPRYLARDVAENFFHADVPFAAPVVTFILQDGNWWVKPAFGIPFISGYVAKQEFDFLV